MQLVPLSIDDPVFNKKAQLNFFERFMLKFIYDERDLPFIYLSLKITFLVIPIAIYLFLPGCFSWWIAIPYLVLNLSLLLGPYILMLHNTSHRPLFKKEYGFMNHYIPWVLGPFYGETPETYFCHHIGMHHTEANLPDDLSSTMLYQRDKVSDFLIYFVRFFFLTIRDLTRYFRERKLMQFFRKVVRGEFSFIFMCIVLAFFNWKATLVVFVLPLIIARFGMMAGNWAQHAFVDVRDPGNSYKNSITCINATYNKTCFNDGYHIGHHLRPSMHWTDMPADFLKNRAKYVENGSIVFKHIDFFIIWFLLMTKNYDYLASKFVDLNGQYESKEEIIALLKERTRKIDLSEIAHLLKK